MKSKLITLIGLMCVSSANAALYSLTNNFGGDSVMGITEADGLPGVAVTTRGFQTTEAFATFGVFSVSDATVQASTDPVVLWASFVPFGSNLKAFTATTGGANGVATPIMTSAVAVTGNATFSGKNMYFVVANVTNAAAISATTQFFVYKTANVFQDTDDALVGTTVKTFTGVDGTLLVGESGTYNFKTRTTDTTAGPGFNTETLSAIPEPSAALLGALGVLGLLRRRRI